MKNPDFEPFLSVLEEIRTPVHSTLARPVDPRKIAQVPPINVVITAPARGLKNRIVTKPHPGLVAAAHPLREKVLRLLRADPRCSTVLKGQNERAVREISSGFITRKFLSADLKAATDRIPQSLALALWEGAEMNKLLTERDV